MINVAAATPAELDLTPTEEILKALTRRSDACLVIFSKLGCKDDHGPNGGPFSYHFGGESCCKIHFLHHLLVMNHAAEAGLLSELHKALNDTEPPDPCDLTE